MKITIESKEEKLERARMHAYAMPLKRLSSRCPATVCQRYVVEAIEVTGEPKRVYSSFIRGYETLPVRIAD